MARKDKGHYGEKHPGVSIKKEVAEALKKKKVDGAMTCPLAFQAARELNLTPAEIGQAIDLLGNSPSASASWDCSDIHPSAESSSRRSRSPKTWKRPSGLR